LPIRDADKESVHLSPDLHEPLQAGEEWCNRKDSSALVSARQALQSVLEQDIRSLLIHYAPGIEDFLPFTLRYMRMLDSGFKTSFMAKDTHYYWALDESALI
jgi:hypothetical protein